MADVSLTARQTQMLEYIVEYRQLHGISPSIREIGVALFIASPNGVLCHLTALVRKGKLKHKPGMARSFVPVEEPAVTDPELESLLLCKSYDKIIKKLREVLAARRQNE